MAQRRGPHGVEGAAVTKKQSRRTQRILEHALFGPGPAPMRKRSRPQGYAEITPAPPAVPGDCWACGNCCDLGPGHTWQCPVCKFEYTPERRTP